MNRRWLLAQFYRMKFNRTSRLKLLILSLLILLIISYTVVMKGFGSNRLRDPDFLELNSCPACYGRKMCNDFHSGAIQFTGYSRLFSLHFLNVKNVHKAVLDGKKIVLKKLAHDDELREADSKLCQITGHAGGCDPGGSLFRHEFNAGDALHPASVKGLSDLVMCPSPRLMQRMEERFNEKEEYLLHSEKLMIYTTLLVNPEPLVLQMFPAKEGWPFPNYYGACGRWIAVEDIPNPLSNYINHDFVDRVKLAKQMLEIAHRFTSDPSEFNLYWTDVDYDNYRVRDDGTVVIVDAENVLVVDKQKVRADKPADYTQPLYSKFDQCKQGHNCLSFQPDKLCSRLDADLNIYAVCRDILAPEASQRGRPNLLHSVPDEMEDRFELTAILRECSKPSTPNGRYQVKTKLLTIFEEIISGSPV